MCYRIAQFVFLIATILSAVAIFVPWQNFLFISTPEANRWLATKIILLPLPVFFALGALWAADKARNSRS